MAKHLNYSADEINALLADAEKLTATVLAENADCNDCITDSTSGNNVRKWSASAAVLATMTNLPTFLDEDVEAAEIQYTATESGGYQTLCTVSPTTGLAIFIRAYLSGSFTGWRKIIDNQNTQHIYRIAYGGGENIPASSDLNDYKTVGRYYAGASASSTISNRPESLNYGFNVTVSSIFDLSRVKQTVYYNTPNTNGQYYERYYTSSGWSSWYKYSGEVVS